MTALNGDQLGTPAIHSSRVEHGASRFGAVPVFYTIAETAELCRRSEGTVRNLVSRHQLPRKTAWVVRRRLRRRVMLLSPSVVTWLQKITLLRDAEALRDPPR